MQIPHRRHQDFDLDVKGSLHQWVWAAISEEHMKVHDKSCDDSHMNRMQSGQVQIAPPPPPPPPPVKPELPDNYGEQCRALQFGLHDLLEYFKHKCSLSGGCKSTQEKKTSQRTVLANTVRIEVSNFTTIEEEVPNY